jgi:iron complex outermembrane receptor protein
MVMHCRFPSRPVLPFLFAEIRLNLQKTPIALMVGALAVTHVHAQSPAGSRTLDQVTVTATRSQATINSVPQSITIVDRKDIEEQSTAGQGLGDILGKLVPGFGVGRQSPSTFTQNFRGRNINVLIDGVPQSTNRNGARVLTLIDPSAIERVEVIRGASAIYGDGATGGVINIITRKAVDGELTHITKVGGNLSLTHPGDSLGTEVGHTVSGKHGSIDYLANLSLEKSGAFFDARGDRVPPAGTGQGSLAETLSGNFLGKLGFDIDTQQRLQFTVSTYRSDQDTNYTSDPDVPATPHRAYKARAIPGIELDEKEGTDNTVLSLDYSNKNVFGSSMRAQAFRRDYKTVYSPFLRPTGAGGEPIVFQSFIESEKKGGRLEFDTPVSEQHGILATWGIDYINETTAQPGYLHDLATYNASGGRIFRSTGEVRSWVPPYDVENRGFFGQLEWQATDKILVRSGVRRELVDVSVNDFVNLDGGNVTGGKIDYSDTLYNIGAVYDVSSTINLFAGFNQGFSLPDLGLLFRGAADGTSVAALNTRPQKVDNYETGVRANWDDTQASLSVFYSKSDLGTRSGGFNRPVLRAPERIYGIEATLDQTLAKTLRGGGTLTWTEGKRYSETGEEIGYLGNDAIAPIKLTGYLEHDTRADWTNRLQVTYSGERDRFNGNTTNAYQNRINDYAVVDWISQKKLGKRGTLSFGVNNLLNKQYHNVFAQTLVTARVYDNTRYAASTGATAFVSYQHAW